MKRFLIAACLMGALPAAEVFAASVFPWFHTRPKPVFLSEEGRSDRGATKPVSTQRVPYHGTAVYPASGRLYFPDTVDGLQAGRQSHSRAATVLTKGWRSDSQVKSSAAK